jgi:hypothetical protein
MVDADDIVIETLLDDVLDLSIVTEAVDEAVSLIHGTRGSNSDPREALDREIAKVEQERARLVAAITAGGSLDGLIGALQGRETRLVTLRAERAAVRVGGKPLRASDVALVRRDLLTLADAWRTVLAHDTPNARPIVAALLKGRVTFTPTDERKQWELRGEGTLAGVFTRLVSPSGVVPGGDATLRITPESMAAVSRRTSTQVC